VIQDTIAKHVIKANGRGSALGPEQEMKRLQEQNRCLAVSLGAFSAYLASKGLLEEAWQFVHRVHQQDEGSMDG
jgi:hypothetical protein